MIKNLLMTTVATLIVALAPTAAQASFTAQLQAGTLFDASGDPLVGGTLVVLADTNNNMDFGDLTQPTFTPDEGDSVAAVLEINKQGVSLDGGETFILVTTEAGVSNDVPLDIDGGTKYKLVWYDLSFASFDEAAGPGFGVDFGMSTEFVAPTSGTVSVQYLTESFEGGPLPDSAGQVNNATIPEPATAMLAILGAGALAMRRRRSA